MLGIYVTVPIACFRKGLAREYLETERLPPPATCYGFLLALVGETKRERHIGCRVAPAILARPDQSVVLRTVWRVKSKPLGSPGNTRPDFQQLLCNTEVVIWLDSSNELVHGGTDLEARVLEALTLPTKVVRFGGLSLGESTHLVNDVNIFDERLRLRLQGRLPEIFLTDSRGRLTLPVWVDHVGSAGTNYVTGRLQPTVLDKPEASRMPTICPPVR